MSQPFRPGAAPRRALLAVLLFFYLPAFSALAQETTGSITGTVRDASNAVIPGARVTVVHQDTAVSFDAETGPEGVFLVRELRPGRYTVAFEATGFRRREAPHAILLAGRTLRVDAALELGELSETVVVTEAVPLIDTSSTMVAQNVTAEELDRLPKGRSFQGVAILSPSVNTGQIEGGFQINGASAAENNYYIDGVSTTSVIDGSARQSAQLDYVQEVQVKTNGLEAEFGGALGGVVSAITKSGGNEFHGTAHVYYYGAAIGAA